MPWKLNKNYKKIHLLNNVVNTSSKNVPQELSDCLFDPQTQADYWFLLLKTKQNLLLESLKNSPIEYAIVGEVTEKDEYRIIVDKIILSLYSLLSNTIEA